MAHELTQVTEVQRAAALPFGVGLVGADRHLEGDARGRYVQALARHQHPIPRGLWLPGDCMDERSILSLADGTKDPAVLAARKAGSLAGGTTLATMKAAIAADAAFLRDAKTSKQAYEMTYDELTARGIPEAAHEGCGASTYVLKSVANRLELPVLGQTFAAIGANVDAVRGPLSALDTNKERRLQAGFFGDWSPSWHADFVSSRQPGNFSYLKTDDTPTHGHNASGVLLVADGSYFAKNDFIEDTGGLEAFTLTFGFADQIADALGGSDYERELMKLAYRDDAFNVANHIVAPGLEVFASAS